MNTINTTKLETALLQVIAINELNQWNGSPLGKDATAYHTLTQQFTLTDHWSELILLENKSTNKNPLHKGNIAGVIGSAVKKGLVHVEKQATEMNIDEDNTDLIRLTDLGLETYRTVANDLV